MLYIAGLKSEGGADGGRGPVELGDERVAPQLVRYAAVGPDRLREAAKGVSYAIVGERLVLLYEGRGADHVGVKDGGQLLGSTLFHRASRGETCGS